MTGGRPDRSLSRFVALLFVAIAVTTSAAACSGIAPTPQTRTLFPDRPSTIDIVRIDPCSVLSENQKSTLGVDAGTPRTADVGVGSASRGCAWINSDEGYGYTFQTIPIGAEAAMESPGSLLQVVSGFGAVQNQPDQVQGSGIPPTCQLTIDVNQGQAIRVQVQPVDIQEGRSEELLREACGRARAFAADTLTTLTTQQP